MYLGIPQAIYLSLTILGLMYALVKHGESKPERHNFFSNLIATSLCLGLLFWGGFFDKLVQ